MENSLNFNIGKEEFSVIDLIDGRIDDVEVQRLIKAVKSKDDSYLVEEPILEDIVLPQDNWSCHMVDNIGVTFEFVCDELCYITFESEKFRFSETKYGLKNILICNKAWLGKKYSVFYSKKCKQKGMFPNRYVPVLNTD